MKKLKQLQLYSVISVSCALLPMAGVAQNKLQPIEVRAQIGYTDFEVDDAHLILAAGCERQPAECPESQTSDTQDTAYSFLLTYNAWQNHYFNVALEGGYTDYGQANYRAYYGANDNHPAQTGERTIDSKAWNAALKGQVFLTKWFQPYIKFGVAYVKTHLTQDNIISVRQPEDRDVLDANESFHDILPQLDIGVDFRLNNYITGYVNYTQLFGSGDTVDFGDPEAHLSLPSSTPEIRAIFAGIAIGVDPFRFNSRS